MSTRDRTDDLRRQQAEGGRPAPRLPDALIDILVNPAQLPWRYWASGDVGVRGVRSLYEWLYDWFG